MRATLGILVLIFTFSVIPRGESQNHRYTQQPEDMDEILSLGEQLYNLGQYQLAYRLLRSNYHKVRDRFYWWELIMAKSLCHSTDSDWIEGGKGLLKNMLEVYHLEGEFEEQVSGALASCGQQVAVRIEVNWEKSPVSFTGVISSKMYYLGHEDDVWHGFEAVPLRITSPVSSSVLQERIYSIHSPEHAEQSTNNLLSELFPERAFGILTYGHFILVGDRRFFRASTLRDGGEWLQEFLEFIKRAYGVPEIPHMITVYLVPLSESLAEYGEKLHHLTLGERAKEEMLGYAFHQDKSVVARVLDDATRWGTLSHELFHLVVRTHFGSIPSWLDEGIAALYEQPRVIDGTFIGMPNWRGTNVLARFRGDWPTIYELVRMDWQEFYQPSMRPQAVNSAIARYFALWLQEEGILSEVYSALRLRDLSSFVPNPGDGTVRIIESITQKSIREINSQVVSLINRLHG